jgi:hypothetical protein
MKVAQGRINSISSNPLERMAMAEQLLDDVEKELESLED